MSEREKTMGVAQSKDQAQEVVVAQPNGDVVRSETAQLMSAITQAARDPAVDMDKFERLMSLHEKLMDREAERSFNEAMNAAQTEMAPIRTNQENTQTKSKYADLPALDRAMRPIYSKHGFSLSYNTGEGAAQDYVRVVCSVAHTGGFTKTYHVDMPADGKGAKGGDVMTKTHATGSALTYGQRYLLKLIFNIAVGEDDDGNAAGARGMTGAVQTAIGMINECADEIALAAWKTKNERVIEALSQAEQTAVLGAYNARRSRMREAI